MLRDFKGIRIEKIYGNDPSIKDYAIYSDGGHLFAKCEDKYGSLFHQSLASMNPANLWTQEETKVLQVGGTDFVSAKRYRIPFAPISIFSSNHTMLGKVQKRIGFFSTNYAVKGPEFNTFAKLNYNWFTKKIKVLSVSSNPLAHVKADREWSREQREKVFVFYDITFKPHIHNNKKLLIMMAFLLFDRLEMDLDAGAAD